MVNLKTVVWPGLLLAGIWGGVVSRPIVAEGPPNQEARKVTKRVPPAYPAIARQARLGGTVKLQLVVAPDGHVKGVKTLGGHPVLIVAAEEAVRHWIFAAVTKESTERVAVKFEMP